VRSVATTIARFIALMVFSVRVLGLRQWLAGRANRSDLRPAVDPLVGRGSRSRRTGRECHLPSQLRRSAALANASQKVHRMVRNDALCPAAHPTDNRHGAANRDELARPPDPTRICHESWETS